MVALHIIEFAVYPRLSITSYVIDQAQGIGLTHAAALLTCGFKHTHHLRGHARGMSS